MSSIHEAIQLSSRAITYQLAGNHEQAIDYYQQAIAMLREIGDAEGEAAALGSLGDLHKETRQYDQAIECFQQALLIYREIAPHKEREKDALRSLCQIYLLPDTGIELGAEGWTMVMNQLHQLADLSHELGDMWTEGETLLVLGQLNSTIGRWKDALIFLEEAKATGFKPMEDPKLLDREISEARDAYKIEATVESLLNEIHADGDLHREATFLFYKAGELHRIGTYNTRRIAVKYAEHALDIYERIGDPLGARVREELSKWNNESEKKWWQFWK